MEQQVRLAMQRHGMIEKGDNVIVALSGGADSVALFHFLLQNAGTLGITLAAAHFEHGIRGEESLRDAAFARDMCEAAGVPFCLEHGRMAEQGQAGEEQARQLRYGFLGRLAQEKNAKVALAHTQSDNAETVLFNAVRGAGPRGLSGIPPVRLPYVRPLLWVTRAQVEEYCTRHKLAYMTDSTNHEAVYSRNRLRLVVMPELEKVHPGASAALGRMANDMRELNGWLEALAGEVMAAARKGAGYDAGKLLEAPPPVRLKVLGMLAGPKADRKALERMAQVLKGELSAVQIPGGAVFRLRRGVAVLEAHAPKGAAEPYCLPLKEGIIELPGGYRLEVQVLKADGTGAETEKINKKGLTFVADCDRINWYCFFRPRRPKDYFLAKKRGVTKTIKKWMSEEQVPAAAREGLPLLAEGSRVVWIWGHGFCEGTQPTAQTRRLLVIKTDMNAEENNGEMP